MMLHLKITRMRLKVHVIVTDIRPLSQGSDWLTPIPHLIGQNLHRLTTSDKPATCNPDTRISFANLFSLHIFAIFQKQGRFFDFIV